MQILSFSCLVYYIKFEILLKKYNVCLLLELCMEVGQRNLWSSFDIFRVFGVGQSGQYLKWTIHAVNTYQSTRRNVTLYFALSSAYYT